MPIKNQWVKTNGQKEREKERAEVSVNNGQVNRLDQNTFLFLGLKTYIGRSCAKQEVEKDTLLSVYGKFRKAWFPATVFPSHPVAAGLAGRHFLPKFPDHLQLQHAR